MDKLLQDIYSGLILEYQSGFNPPQRIKNQETPQEAGTKLSYNKQTIGVAPPMVTSHVYGEQEEEPAIFEIIDEVEKQFGEDSSEHNAVRLALSMIKQKLNQ
jgi:hypothetical protein